MLMMLINCNPAYYFRKKLCLLTFAAIFGISGTSLGQSIKGIPESCPDIQRWVSQHFAKGKIPPFSFVYDGKKSNEFIKGWQFRAEKLKSTDSAAEESVFTYTDPKTGLVVKCLVTCFTDFHAVEWVLRFSNTSAANTPIIEQAAVIDQTFTGETSGNYILHHNRGSDAQRNDFQPIDEKMKVGKPVYMTPVGGRSSDNTTFPFFNIEAPGQQGILAAVGWTGKWYANV